MNIKGTIAAINQMRADGVIKRYAIGGAVGATFYLEPVAMLDLDVFIRFQAEGRNLMASPQPIVDYLKKRGGRMEGEYIVPRHRLAEAWQRFEEQFLGDKP